MSYSGLFTPGPSPRGRSASRHDDNIFGSPRSRSSGSKSRPRLLEPKLDNPLDLIFGSSSPSRRSGRCRRPSISVAYAGASYTTARTHDSDYLEPIFASPTSRAPRSPRYPPSASKSGSLLYTSAGPPADDRDGGGARSRPRHRSPISLGDAANTDIFPVKFGTGDLLVYRPDSSSRRPRASSSVRRALDPFKPRSGTTSWSGSGDYASRSSAGDAFEPSRILRRPTAPALEQPFRSKFFGSGSSSSGSGPSAPHPLEGDPSVTSRRRSRSSDRSKESSLLGRVSGDDDFALPPPTTSAGRTNTRRPPRLRRTHLCQVSQTKWNATSMAKNTFDLEPNAPNVTMRTRTTIGMQPMPSSRTRRRKRSSLHEGESFPGPTPPLGTLTVWEATLPLLSVSQMVIT
jgi:hypothetical protein